MRESISNSYIFMIVLIFVSILMILLISSISMSKIFKVRNRIVDIIETRRGYNETANREIEEVLVAAGYTPTVGVKSFTEACRKFTKREANDAILVNAGDTWQGHTYCIYQHNVKSGIYYTVYVKLEYSIPVVGAMVPITSRGDTKIMSSLF